jgi:hypothetical protein
LIRIENYLRNIPQSGAPTNFHLHPACEVIFFRMHT